MCELSQRRVLHLLFRLAALRGRTVELITAQDLASYDLYWCIQCLYIVYICSCSMRLQTDAVAQLIYNGLRWESMKICLSCLCCCCSHFISGWSLTNSTSRIRIRIGILQRTNTQTQIQLLPAPMTSPERAIKTCLRCPPKENTKKIERDNKTTKSRAKKASVYKMQNKQKTKTETGKKTITNKKSNE